MKSIRLKLTVLFFLAVWFNVKSEAATKRNLLQQSAGLEKVKASLITDNSWITYPKYTDREAWDKLTGVFKEEVIANGEAFLQFEWKVVKATDYLEFERSGSRKIMEDPMNANTSALFGLVLAELAEGEGRFLDQIANGIWFMCEMTSWSLSAHISREQKEKTSLPSFKENIIDLKVGDIGSFMAWTCYFLQDELNKVQPLVTERLRQNIKERILDPYLERSNFWWQAFDAAPGTLVNNWNPWCNANVLQCFMLIEDDHTRLAEAVYRTMVSVDQFINYGHEDGACEEGPSYWGHAAGKMYDYLQLLYNITGGKISLFNEQIIRNMGEYISRSYVGNGWVVNFADASAKGGGEIGLIYRYGKAVRSEEMQHFAAYLFEKNGKKGEYRSSQDFYRTLENLTSQNELAKTKAVLAEWKTTWYPETEFCYMRNDNGFYFATKGGYNNESHNHNDMGSFMLYLNNVPLIIDAGVGTYTRQTFSDERYSIWTMQSNYHNLPVINGFAQAPGSQYRSSSVNFNAEKSTFSLDLAKAYPEEAGIKKWQRTYQLSLQGLTISDKFLLTKAQSPNLLNFLLWSEPDISVPGTVRIKNQGAGVKLMYNALQFEPILETIPLNDKRLSDVWGAQLFRLSLKAKKLNDSGNYMITINQM